MKPPTFCTLATLCAGACFVASEVFAQQIEELPPRPPCKRTCPRDDDLSKEYLEQCRAAVQNHWKSQSVPSDMEHLCLYCLVDDRGKISIAGVPYQHQRRVPDGRIQKVTEFFNSLSPIGSWADRPNDEIKVVEKVLPGGKKVWLAAFKYGNYVPVDRAEVIEKTLPDGKRVLLADFKKRKSYSFLIPHVVLLVQFRTFPEVALREGDRSELTSH